MRRIYFIALIAGAAAASAAPPPPTRYTIEQLMGSEVFGGLTFAPDNQSLLLTSTRSGTSNLYTLSLSDKKLKPLTHSSESLGALGYFPDGRILYTSDQGGNELAHIYVLEKDGTSRDITPGAKLKARFVDWAHDKRSIFVATNERDPRFFDLYEYAVKGYARKLLFQNDASYQIRAVSPDRRYVALSRIIDNANTAAYLYDTQSKALKALTPESGGVASTPQTFSSDSASLFLVTDQGREFAYLMRLNLVSGERQTVLQASWDVESAGISDDGRYLIVSVNEDTRSKLHLFDPKTLSPIGRPDTGSETLNGLAIAHEKPLAAIVQANGDVPGDVYLLDLKTAKKTLLLRSLSPDVKQADLVPGDVARFKSYDGLTVPGVLYVPRGAEKRGNLPAVIWVHGGPGGESRIGYQPLLQMLTNHGYVVYAVNNRGSAGSGRTFYHLDDRKHGDADLDDVVAAKRMLIGTGYVDGSRIAIAGGSYGGYMTLAALTFRPQEFVAGVDLYGVANWIRLLPNTPAWWEDLRRLLATEMGDYQKDADYLRSISPIFHAERIVKPLLVLQGANDPRVLQQESDDIVAKVRANNVPVEYVVFPDEGHGFRKKANEIAAYKAVDAFLDKHVKVAGTAGAVATTDAQRLDAFFEAVHQRDLSRSPIAESRLGIKTHQDRWDDISEQRQLEDLELTRHDLTQLHGFDASKVPPDAQLSYRLFERDAQKQIDDFKWRRSSYLVTQMGGIHRTVATVLLNSHPIATLADAQAYISRLAGVKRLMAQLVTQLGLQEQAGVRPPRFVYDLTIGEAQNLITGKPFDTSDKDSPLLADFRKKVTGAELAEADRGKLIAQAEEAMRSGVGPGYRQLIDHLREAQRPATDDAGVWKLPDGAAFYRHTLESYTTLPVTAEELHALGLKEVARIQDEMRAVASKVEFKGSLEEFFTYVRNDPKFYYPDTEEGKAQYVADAEGLLATVLSREHEIFGRVPSAKVVVKPVEAWREKAAAKAFYQNPPLDGSRPGIFYINLYDMRAAPKYQLAAILYHEAVPGHHVETVVAHELPNLPSFRKLAGFAAFSEGWGLYSERLAKEMGLYRDPYEDFGRLSLSLMRAARLVVDTGLHSKRWTREQAAKYMDDNMPSSHYDNQREIDRYIVLPGQATSYYVGMMKIVELRERARQALGARFDLKAFHDVVLGSGPLPMPILEENVTAWIKARGAAPDAAAVLRRCLALPLQGRSGGFCVRGAS